MKHRISLLSSNLGVVKQTREVSWEELQEVITQSAWAPGTFIDGHRTIAAFEQTTLLALDIDSDCTIERASEIFANYRFIVAPSKSHQKEKVTPSGRVIPACDRFRLILELSEPITNDADFKATWFAAQALCPAIDPACKDASRFFYPSQFVVSNNDGGAFPVSKAAPKQEVTVPTPFLLTSARLTPSHRTMRFISTGAPDGQWHGELVAACMDLKQQQWSKEEARAILVKASPTFTLDQHDDGVIDDVWANREPRHAPRIQLNDAVAKLIKSCHMIRNLADINEVRMVDLSNGCVHDIDPDAIKTQIFGDELKEYMNTRCVTAKFTYDPRIVGPLTTDATTGVYIYNTFVPPLWLERAFYRGEAMQPRTDLPAIYDRFFTHLTAGHGDSKEYLLDWLAVSLQSRNFTILTAIGEQGIGKGTLAEVMKKLHGEKNFSDCRDSVFKERFNAKLENKTLVYVDEIDLRTKESQDRIKAVVNTTLEIEKKGIDATTVRNHASFYISSNSMDAIKLEAGDRRFSIIQLTDVKLNTTPLFAEINDILDDTNVSELARYLYGRKVTRNMMVPFRSARFEEVQTAGLNDWELFILEEYVHENAGGTPTLKDAQDKIVENKIMRQSPGWRKFKDLEKKFPDMFRLRQRKKGGARYLEIPREPKGFGMPEAEE